MSHDDVKKTDKMIKKMFRKALKTRENAYVPFSKFKVGAAVLTKAGDIFTGCNVENSSFGLTVCAERVAMFTAAAAGVRPGEITTLCCTQTADGRLKFDPSMIFRTFPLRRAAEAFALYRNPRDVHGKIMLINEE